jgi:hypothetical protein
VTVNDVCVPPPGLALAAFAGWSLASWLSSSSASASFGAVTKNTATIDASVTAALIARVSLIPERKALCADRASA